MMTKTNSEILTEIQSITTQRSANLIQDDQYLLELNQLLFKMI